MQIESRQTAVNKLNYIIAPFCKTAEKMNWIGLTACRSLTGLSFWCPILYKLLRPSDDNKVKIGFGIMLVLAVIIANI